MMRREQKAGVKAVNFKSPAFPHWKCELSWPGPEHSACPCLFPLLQSPVMKQQVGLWMAKPFQFLQLPPYRSRMSPMLFLPGRAQWQCTEWSGSSWAQGHLHHCSASSHLQASYKEKKKKKNSGTDVRKQKTLFLNHPQIHLATRIKYWCSNLTAAILSKVQREPRFFQLIRYLSSYIYVWLCTHPPSLPSPKSRGKKDYFSISRDDWSLYIFTTESVINVLINHCGGRM